jgi:hypothetical protein
MAISRMVLDVIPLRQLHNPAIDGIGDRELQKCTPNILWSGSRALQARK